MTLGKIFAMYLAMGGTSGNMMKTPTGHNLFIWNYISAIMNSEYGVPVYSFSWKMMHPYVQIDCSNSSKFRKYLSMVSGES